MFKKIVSNLPFSPALVGQLGPYSKSLRKEKTARRLGLIFVVLALIVQSLALFQPPESANASNPTDTNPIATQTLDNNLVKTMTASNASQGFLDATIGTASAGDQISYTINIKNDSSASIVTKIQESLSDALEYSMLVDNGGGRLDKTTAILSWPETILAANTEQTRTFAIRLLDSVPATARGTINTKSYDCIITNNFGNTIDINVDCPAVKTIENIVSQLPSAGITENIVLAITVLAITAFLYARSKQLEKEIHLIRKDTTAGTL